MSKSFQDQLTDDIGSFYADPLGYVLYNFPWEDEDAGIQQVPLKEPWRTKYQCEFGPDQWQCEFLTELGEQVRERNFDGKHGVPPIRFSTASGHGIGKSSLVAWLVLWIMDTRPRCKGTVTANTDTQLRTKTWAEVGKWLSLALTKDRYEYFNTRGNMLLRRKGESPDAWFVTAQTCKEENSEAFAGQHAPNSTSFFIFDEASGIPGKLFDVREGGLTDGHPMIFDFGNPTQNSGRFYENCVGNQSHRYITKSIDSRTCFIPSQSSLHKEWEEDYGVDSDFFKVRVRGLFPAAGSSQFVSIADVDEAMNRALPEDRYAPLVIGVDCARMGDNESVIYPRMGMDARSFPVKRYIGLKADQLVDKIIQEVQFFRSLGKEVSGLFVDSTGIGGPVCDYLYKYGYAPIPVNFGNVAKNKTTYRLIGDEIWGKMRDAIRDRLCLPSSLTDVGASLKEQLIQREFGYTLSNQIKLENKDEMKGRGVVSPDIADALACTFFSEINSLYQREGQHTIFANSEYEPYETRSW